jgi:hypothetical protein
VSAAGLVEVNEQPHADVMVVHHARFPRDRFDLDA